MKKPNKRSAEHRNRLERVARKKGIKINTVEKIMRGDRNNDEVFEWYMELLEVDRVIDKMDSILLDQVKKLVPFN